MFRSLLLFCCLPGLAAAGELHKCQSAEGQLSYQSAPCAPGARTLWVRDALPETVPPSPVTRVAAAEPAAPRAAVARSRAVRRDPRESRCAAARRSADARRDRDWNRLGFRERSELDAAVARACAR